MYILVFYPYRVQVYYYYYLHHIIPPAPRVSFQVKETWTHEFLCLGSTRATCVPSHVQKIASQNAGLGRQKVVFHCKASSINVKTKLESVYPKLIQGGGFEILRSGWITQLQTFFDHFSCRGIFCLISPGQRRTQPGTSLHQATSNRLGHECLAKR